MTEWTRSGQNNICGTEMGEIGEAVRKVQGKEVGEEVGVREAGQNHLNAT